MVKEAKKTSEWGCSRHLKDYIRNKHDELLEICAMVKAFDMLFEYDSGYVVDGYKVPMSYELGSFEEFFYLHQLENIKSIDPLLYS